MNSNNSTVSASFSSINKVEIDESMNKMDVLSTQSQQQLVCPPHQPAMMTSTLPPPYQPNQHQPCSQQFNARCHLQPTTTFSSSLPNDFIVNQPCTTNESSVVSSHNTSTSSSFSENVHNALTTKDSVLLQNAIPNSTLQSPNNTCSTLLPQLTQQQKHRGRAIALQPNNTSSTPKHRHHHRRQRHQRHQHQQKQLPLNSVLLQPLQNINQGFTTGATTSSRCSSSSRLDPSFIHDNLCQKGVTANSLPSSLPSQTPLQQKYLMKGKHNFTTPPMSQSQSGERNAKQAKFMHQNASNSLASINQCQAISPLQQQLTINCYDDNCSNPQQTHYKNSSEMKQQQQHHLQQEMFALLENALHEPLTPKHHSPPLPFVTTTTTRPTSFLQQQLLIEQQQQQEKQQQHKYQSSLPMNELLFLDSSSSKASQFVPYSTTSSDITSKGTATTQSAQQQHQTKRKQTHQQKKKQHQSSSSSSSSKRCSKQASPLCHDAKRNNAFQEFHEFIRDREDVVAMMWKNLPNVWALYYYWAWFESLATLAIFKLPTFYLNYKPTVELSSFNDDLFASENVPALRDMDGLYTCTICCKQEIQPNSFCRSYSMCKTCYLGVVNPISSWIKRTYPNRDVVSDNNIFRRELCELGTCIEKRNSCPKERYHHAQKPSEKCTLCRCLAAFDLHPRAFIDLARRKMMKYTAAQEAHNSFAIPIRSTVSKE
eukprot:m.2887 g.2887  ORF g.2887 m.2887 type:complete len:710 (+) comp1966_c0_seq1:369-2498(+)